LNSVKWDLEKAIKFLNSKAGRKLTKEMEKYRPYWKLLLFRRWRNESQMPRVYGIMV